MIRFKKNKRQSGKVFINKLKILKKKKEIIL